MNPNGEETEETGTFATPISTVAPPKVGAHPLEASEKAEQTEQEMMLVRKSQGIDAPLESELEKRTLLKTGHLPLFPSIPKSNASLQAITADQDNGSTFKTSLKENSVFDLKTTSHVLPSRPCRAIVRGKDQLSPYTDVKAFPLHDIVEKGLRYLKIADINDLQRCAWPHIFRGRNCILVGGPSNKQGKTISYLVPVVAKMIKDVEIMRKKRQHGPVAVILCASSICARKIEVQLELLVGRSMAIYRGAKSDSLQSIQTRLKGNPEFIICKPDFFSTLSVCNPNLMTYDRLRYLIVDDCHIIEEECAKSIGEVFETVSHQIERNSTRNWPMQFIICGQEWNQICRDAFGPTSPFNNPILVMSSFTQALKLGRVQLVVRFVEEKEKCDYVADVVENSIVSSKHVLVVCQSRGTAYKVAQFFMEVRGLQTTYFTLDEDESMQDQTRRIRSVWANRSESHPVILVVGDCDLIELDLIDVTTIVHYDMPLRKLDAFGQRHVCMWNLFPDVQPVDCNQGTDVESELKSYVLLAHDEAELEKIVDHLQLLNALIPGELLEVAKKLKVQDLSSAAVCKGIKLFGRCSHPNKRLCERTYRHYFTKESLEAESTIPKFTAGRVELKILGCFSVNQYIARVLHFYEVKNGKKINSLPYDKLLQRRRDVLNKFFDNPAERKLVPEPVTEEIYGIMIKTDEYEGFTRAMFDQSIKTQHGGGRYLKLRFWCIDVGVFVQISPDNVYFLPDNFKRLAPLIVNVILANIKPFGNDDEFRQNGNGFENKAKNILQNKILTAPVALAMENTVWVKSLYENVHKVGGEWVQELDARYEFLKRFPVAEDNPDHLKKLYELCALEGYDCSVYMSADTIDSEFHRLNDPYQWASLRISSFTDPMLIETFCVCAISPDRLYVIQSNFCELKYRLQLELSKEVESLITEKYPDYNVRFIQHYQVGLCVAAIDYDGLWARAIITGFEWIVSGASLQAFFVDHGFFRAGLRLENIFPLPHRFVKRLPFQTIALRLSHVKPLGFSSESMPSNDNCDRNWPVNAKDYVNSILFGPDGVAMRIDVLPIRKRKKTQSTTLCNCYDAYILGHDVSTDELGEGLVKRKLAEFTEGSEKNLDIFKTEMLRIWNDITDEHTKDSESEDAEYSKLLLNNAEDLDRYDVSLGSDPRFVCQVLDDMGVPVRQMDEIPTTSKPNSTLTFGDITDASEDSPGSQLACGSIPGVITESSEPRINADRNICNKQLKCPEVRWSQSKTHVFLRVCLADIKEYKFSLHDDLHIVSFVSTIPPQYSFSINLYGKIMEITEENLTGQNLAVKLKKMTALSWESLLFGCAKPPRWLKIDMDHYMPASDDEDPVAAVLDNFYNDLDLDDLVQGREEEHQQRRTDTDYSHAGVDESDSSSDEDEIQRHL